MLLRRVILAILLLALPAAAQEIDGVEPAAIDQPRINLVVRTRPAGPPLFVKSDHEDFSNVEAFLDTGASGVVLSAHTADQLGVDRESVAGGKTNVLFQDVGVGGGDKFAVSDPIYISIAPSTSEVNGNDLSVINSTYNENFGPLRAEVGPLGMLNGLMALLTMSDMDIAGIPAMQGKIVVMDTKDVNNFTDKIHTTIYDANAQNVIPRTSRHVKLSYADFARYTTTTPATAPGPSMAANPFIGPSPLLPPGAHDSTPPVIAISHGRRISCSFLLDTGAAASMISEAHAAELGVRYDPANATHLLGVPDDKQFTLQIGGIGGMKTAAGFYLDKLILPTIEGTPITFLHAPVLVSDITVADPVTKKQITLDGVFGMNFLVASADIDTSGLLPDINKISPGMFRWIVFDQPRGLLGLE
ncbi:MAG TPA: aspartyl protease family protein [Tepidisphaeraceae bacterium]|nr:aspartyl protease family protein [Tepidisphaeraceae bacterium]